MSRGVVVGLVTVATVALATVALVVAPAVRADRPPGAGPPPATEAPTPAAAPPATEVDTVASPVTADIRPLGVEPRGLTDADARDVGPWEVRLPGARLTDESAAVVTVDGRWAQSDWVTDDDTLRITVRHLPPSAAGTDDVALRVRARLVGSDGAVGHADEVVVLHRGPPVVTTPEGYEAIGGHGHVVGVAGVVRPYSLEVEPAAGIDVRAFADVADALLHDARGWTASDAIRLQRVPPDEAEIRVLLARPATVDRLCAAAGLRTSGFYSCWTGRFAALNLDRWQVGAPAFDAPLETYRGYLLHHEVGHGLGFGHVGCPHAGAAAPIMMQQTKGTGACVPNAWPYP